MRPGARRCRRRAGQRAADRGAGNRAARQRPDDHPEHSQDAADRRREPRRPQRERRQSTEMPGLANFTVSMLDQGTATRNAVQIANESAQLGATVNTNSSMDASTIAARSLKRISRRHSTSRPISRCTRRFRRRKSSGSARAGSGQLVQQRENANVLSGRIVNTALYGDRHPHGYTEIGTEAVGAGADARRDDDVTGSRTSCRTTPRSSSRATSRWRSCVRSRRRCLARGSEACRRCRHWPQRRRRRLASSSSTGPARRRRSFGSGRSERRDRCPSSRRFRSMNTELGGLFSSRINMNLREEHGVHLRRRIRLRLPPRRRAISDRDRRAHGRHRARGDRRFSKRFAPWRRRR